MPSSWVSVVPPRPLAMRPSARATSHGNALRLWQWQPYSQARRGPGWL
eukprot:CAMPEP_0204285114 /NCGR_PEP_ID=MMETSP0468-20130131/49913_1 /ASSEMBLY_ACC=CAM_ASM_000383 /TAXON_ID=2969 /ORGANISM="Oxyrrhis marina" /LENGTH=47 /DNA_ID= /DNA_START= /DNA_END= /DNA_ORIENTATION=